MTEVWRPFPTKAAGSGVLKSSCPLCFVVAIGLGLRDPAGVQPEVSALVAGLV